MASKNNQKMQEFQTLAEMKAKSTDTPNKLIAVLFNVQYPERGSLESRLTWWRQTFEKDNNVIFCKRVCSRGESQLQTEFQIAATPAFIFFYNGEEVGSLKALNETKADYQPRPKPDQDTDDEKTLKTTIIGLCNRPQNKKQETKT